MIACASVVPLEVSQARLGTLCGFADGGWLCMQEVSWVLLYTGLGWGSWSSAAHIYHPSSPWDSRQPRMVFSSHWQDRNHGTVKPSYFFRLFSQNCHSVIFTSFFFFFFGQSRSRGQASKFCLLWKAWQREWLEWRWRIGAVNATNQSLSTTLIYLLWFKMTGSSTWQGCLVNLSI
jgi:hypothetical protein